MQEFFEALTSSNAVGLGIAILIFLITVVLVVKRLIGFVFTLILLFFAIVSGFAIANHGLVREFLQKDGAEPYEKKELSLQALKEQLFGTFKDLREEVCEYTKPTAGRGNNAYMARKYQEILDKLEAHEQKLQALVDEARADKDSEQKHTATRRSDEP